jgi:drug/metabolite transporter (DMT)-like permease
MKPQLIVGILLAVLGAFIVFRGLNYGSQQSVIQVGDMRASVEARRTIPTWVGAVAIVGGVLLVGAGMQRRARGA